jgi:hypothetical protein
MSPYHTITYVKCVLRTHAVTTVCRVRAEHAPDI